MKTPASDFPRIFLDTVKKPLRLSVPLSEYSTLRIGGPADAFFEAASADELLEAIRLARALSFPHYIIGGGCNLLFDDEGFRGLIIKNSVKGVASKESEGRLEFFSGTPLSVFVEFLASRGLAGGEFLAGIPGTIGGAVFGNAGAFGKNIGGLLESATLLDPDGKEQSVPKDYFSFGYRHSVLKEKHDILLKAVFQLEKGDKENVKSAIQEYLRAREAKHPPYEMASAGSYFRNPVLPDGTREAAGYLLEQAGAKGLQVGRAAVFPGHCNFIINLDRASARDVLLLAQMLKEMVRDKFGIELEEEVIYLPATFSLP